MAYRSATPLVVLHALKLKGFADVAALADSTGLAEGEIDQQLAHATGCGWVMRRSGRVPGWALTPEGRTRHDELLEADLDGSGAEAVLVAAYADFAGINTRFKQVCTDWQLRTVDGTHVPNDHSDRDYDRGVVAALRGIDDAVRPVCVALGGALERMARYAGRLGGALARVEGGDRDGFTRPLAGSYHDIWMELHEDLIGTLRVARTAADA